MYFLLLAIIKFQIVYIHINHYHFKFNNIKILAKNFKN